MERVKWVTELLHKLKRNACAILGVLNRVGAVFPWADGAAGSERIGAGTTERVPINDAEPQVVPHRLAADLFVCLVVMEGKRVLRLWAFVLDAFDLGKSGLHGNFTCSSCERFGERSVRSTWLWFPSKRGL